MSVTNYQKEKTRARLQNPTGRRTNSSDEKKLAGQGHTAFSNLLCADNGMYRGAEQVRESANQSELQPTTHKAATPNAMMTVDIARGITRNFKRFKWTRVTREIECRLISFSDASITIRR